MSRLYFHTPSATAELHGSERLHLSHVAGGPARAVWALGRRHDLDWIADILSLVPEVPDGKYGSNYLHTYLRRAQAEQARSRAAAAADRQSGQRGWDYNPEPINRLVQAMQVRLNDGITDTVLRVAGVDLQVLNVNLNTALAAGSDLVRLAAKIDGWCESHCWFAGTDRAWLTDLIDQGLQIGVYRREAAGFSQGWEQVQELLRARDDEPVVLSYSAGARFPNPEIAGWEPAVDQQWRPDWATDHDGATEWAELSEDDRTGQRRDHAAEQWDELPDQRQWELAMAGLQQTRPWAQITPDNLATTTFGPGVTVYDLLAPDRDARVTAIAQLVTP